MSHLPIALGIDLGSSRSALAIASPLLAPRILEWQAHLDQAEAALSIPTALFFPTESPGIWCGEAAYQAILTMPHRGVHFFKRRMKDQHWYLEIDDATYDAQALTSAFLKYLRNAAATHADLDQATTCITIPAYFEDLARRRTILAAQDAGWQRITLLNEPTAAAIAYAASNTSQQPDKLMVFDLGGGTLDVSILTLSPAQIQVHASVGDMNLGGQDWDECLASDAAHHFTQAFHWHLFDDPLAFESLRRACQRAKERLSYQEMVAFSFTYDGCQISLEWRQSDIEDMCQGLLQRCLDTATQALHEARCAPRELDTILLVGGGARMPMIRHTLQRHFACHIHDGLDPATAIAIGASLHAAQQLQLPPDTSTNLDPHNQKYLPGRQLTESTSHPLGFLIHKATQIINRIVIPRHTPLPATTTIEGFTTSTDGQTHIDVFLTQTDALHPSEQAIFDVWRIEDIPTAPAGTLPIRLTFQYQESGIIDLQAAWLKAASTPGANAPEIMPLSTSRQPLAASISTLLQPTPRDIILAMDCSASMQGRYILEAKLAARQFIADLDPGSTRLGLLSFGDPDVTLRVRLDQDPMLLRPHLAALQAKGKTPLGEAIHLAHQALLQDSVEATPRERILLIITDGHPDQPDLAITHARNARQDGIQIFTIGIGAEINQDFLRTHICHTPANFKEAKDPIFLGQILAALAKEWQVPGGELIKYHDSTETA